jgi:hypothetical protein
LLLALRSRPYGFGGIGAVVERLGFKLFFVPIALIVIAGIFASGFVIGISIGLIVLMIIGLIVKSKS